MSKTGGPIAWMAQNPVAANLSMLMVCVGGFIGILTARQEVFPKFELDLVLITVGYPGASPAEVEQGIVLAVEEAIQGIDGVKRITSVAHEGRAILTAEVLRDADVSVVTADIKTAVNAIQSFPEDVVEPVINILSGDSPVISLVIAGDEPLGTLHEIAEAARSDLLRYDGITKVDVEGVPELELSIEVSPQNLEAYGLTLDEIAQQVSAGSLELPSGGLETSSGEILVRVADRKRDTSAFENIVVRSNRVGEVKLGDIATVTDGYADTSRESYYNGKRAVRVTAYRVGDETPTDIADTVRAYRDQLRTETPDTIEVAIWNDQSKLLRERIDLLMRNARSGLILVLIVLAIFLKPHLAGWVAIGIPISFCGAFLLLEPLSLSINMITLFGLLVTLGMVVDDAIIIGENIYSKTEGGQRSIHAAVAGAREMAVPVTFSILTTITAFGPLLFVPGPLGKIFRLIPLMVISVLLFSLFESFFVLPAHLAHPGSNRFARLFSPIERIQRPVADWLSRFTRGSYKRWAERSVELRYVVSAFALAVLIVVGGLVASGAIPVSFFPKLEGDLVVASARLPFGAPVERTLEVQRQVEAALERALVSLNGKDNKDKLTGVYASIGQGRPGGNVDDALSASSGNHLVTVQANLVSSIDRDFTAKELGTAWSQELPKLPGVEAMTVDGEIGGPSGNAVNVQLSHPNTATLAETSEALARALRNYDGLINVENKYSDGKTQLDFHLLPEARNLDITSGDVARQLRSALFGAEAIREQRGRHELKVYVRIPEDQRQSEDILERLRIRAPSGSFVPLTKVAAFDRGHAPTVITRENSRRVVKVVADLGPGLESPRDILTNLQATTFSELQEKYPRLDIELAGEQRDEQEVFGSLMTNFMLATFVIFALLAIPFRSYLQPLIVMSVIPFGMIGAVVGHAIMGYGLSVVSMFGVIALSGVVVNDSLILVTSANTYRAEGLVPAEAIVAGGMRRLRPILLTSLTTFFGLAPMITETSVQARFLIPMAVSLGFGVLFATVIVLLLVPAFYMIVVDVQEWTAKLLGVKGANTQAEPHSSAGTIVTGT